MSIEKRFYPVPYKTKPANNRKMTISRLVTYLRVKSEIQSIPTWDKKTGKFLGFRYVSHDKQVLPQEPKKSVRKIVIPKGCKVFSFPNGFECVSLNNKNAVRKYLS